MAWYIAASAQRSRRLGVLPVIGIQRDADRRLERQREPLERDGLLDRHPHALDRVKHVRAASDLRQQDPELVAAEARDGVGGAQRGLEAPAQLDEQLVARGMAQRVVDLLEAVEIDDRDRAPCVGPPPRVDHVADPVVEQRPVGESGQRIVEGLVLVERGLREQRRLGLLVLGDVLDHRDREAWRPSESCTSDAEESTQMTSPSRPTKRC